MISETATDEVPRSTIKTFKKSLLKSSSSIDKPDKTLDIRITEVRSPSPIPEEEEVSKQPKSTSAGTIDQEKKVDKAEASEKENTQKQSKESGETSEVKKVKEEEKKGGELEDEDENKQSDREGNSGENGDKEEEVSGTKKENNAGKHTESDTKENEPVVVLTTKLRGKSKATGQIMEGWI